MPHRHDQGAAATRRPALRSAGLSYAKTRAVRDLIDKIDSGQLNRSAFRRMTDEQVAEAITQVKGLGRGAQQM